MNDEEESPSLESGETESDLDSSGIETSILDGLPTDGEWLIARNYLSKIGEPSTLFTGCCRSLFQCSNTDGKLTRAAASQLQRLLRSPSMLSQVFFAAKTYYASDIQSRGSIEPADFTFFMQPEEIAIIITIGYNSRRISNQLDKQDWSLLSDNYQRYVDLAMPLGFSIPAIGPTRAMMTAAGKFLGWSILNVVEPERFKKYRIANKVNNRTYNLAQEKANFGTTHLHLSSLIWQRFGMGIQISEEYFAGMSDSPPSTAATKFKVARLWLESLLEKGQAPTQNLGDDFELEDSRSEKFINTFNSLKADGSLHKWLQRNKDDISTEKTPELVADYEGMNKILKKRGRRGSQEE